MRKSIQGYEYAGICGFGELAGTAITGGKPTVIPNLFRDLIAITDGIGSKMPTCVGMTGQLSLTFFHNSSSKLSVKAFRAMKMAVSVGLAN